jgi:hypothetical protein
VIVILLLVLFQLYMLTRCPAGLSMEALLAAQGFQNGIIPYKDFQLHGGPVPTALLSFLFSIPSLVWVSFIFCLFNLWTAYGVYKLSKKRMKGYWVMVPSGLFLLFNAFLEGNALHTETMMLAFGVWGYVFYEKKSYWAMSAMFLLSCLCKQTGIFYLLAVLPWLSNLGRLKTFITFSVLGGLLLLVAHHYEALEAMVYQLSGWTLSHALLDQWPVLDRLKLAARFLFLFGTPTALILYFTKLPKYWLLLGGLFLAHYLFVPGGYYFLGIIPLICVGITTAFYKRGLPKWVYALAVVLISVTLINAFKKMTSHLGLNHAPYNVMDSYYYVSEIDKLGTLEQPVWTNHPQIYFIKHWKVPNNDFLSQIESFHPYLDFNKAPWNVTKTRIYFAHNAEEPSPPGGPWVLYKLNRGLYMEMRVWRV